MKLDDCTFLSLNVRGLRSYSKRTAVFTWLRRKKADIIFLQETYSTLEVENTWKAEWRGKVYFSHGTNHSRGTMILIRDDLEFDFENVEIDPNGRSILLEATVQGFPLLLLNIYAPNTLGQQKHFFSSVLQNLNDHADIMTERAILIGGDFNLFFDTHLDCDGGNPQLKEDPLKLVRDLKMNYDLTDIWRIRNPASRRYTWRQKNPLIQRRLDFWLVSDGLQEDIESVDIIASIKSDHSAITLRIISIDQHKRGPSFWKFNSTLVDDPNYCKLISDLYLKWNCLKGKGLKSNNYLDWFSLVDAIPIKWKQAELLGPNNEPCSPDSDQLKLVFDSREMKITQITSKMFYNILSTKLHEKPTAQERYNLIFSDIRINWKEIYALPFIVALDTRTREFQLKILHRILTTNVMLKKVWLSGISRVYFWQRRRGNSRTFILSLSLFHSFLVRSH